MLHEFAISALRERYNIPFENEELLSICFTNPSTSGVKKINEAGINIHNARTNLVEIGKAVLELCVTSKAFLEYNYDVQTQFLCAKTLKLLFKKSFLKNHELITECALLINNEIPNEKDVSDELLYSFIGYVYYRFGFETIYTIFNHEFGSVAGLKISATEFLDYKTILQEKAQGTSNRIAPYYTVINEQGPDNEKTFTVRVSVSDKFETGTGRSKKLAETAAAKAFLLRYYANDINKEQVIKPHRYIVSRKIEKLYWGKNIGIEWFCGDITIVKECLATKAFSNEQLHDKNCSNVKYVPLGMACLAMALIDNIVFSKQDAIFENLQPRHYIGEKMNHLADMFGQVIYDIRPLMKLSNGERKNEKLRNISALESVKALFAVGYISSSIQSKNINRICNLYPPITRSLFEASISHSSTERDANADPTSIVMQVCQALNWTFAHPLLKESGPQHEPKYTVLCSVVTNKAEEISATSSEFSIKLGRRKSSELVLKKIVHKIQSDDDFLQDVMNSILYSNIKPASKVSILRNLIIPSGIDVFEHICESKVYFYFLELFIKNGFDYCPTNFNSAIDHIKSSEDIRCADIFFQNYSSFVTEDIIQNLISKSDNIVS